MDTFIMLLSMALVQHGYSKKENQCPKLKYCVCNGPKMYCNGYKNYLRTIPRAPPAIVKVYLKDIQLGEITRAMIGNLTHCNMSSLYLKDNTISGISADAFQDLLHLRLLDWQQDHLPLADLEVTLLHVTSDVETIRLKAEHVEQDAMNASVFRNLSKLKSLTLSLKRLITFDASGFSTQMNLEILDLSNNFLHSLIFDRPIPNVKTLRLVGNNFVTVPKLCRDNLPSAMPRLQSLSLTDNAIRRLDVSFLTCLHNLLKLSLSQNRIEVLRDNAFANLPKLQSLDMSRLLVLKRIEPLAFNSTSLYKVYFAMNPILSWKQSDPVNLFAHTPNLGTLDMTSTKMDIGVSDLRDFLLNLKNIERLIMQDTYVKFLPDGVFSQLKKLNHVVLSGNFISGWNDTVFVNATHIKQIFFDGCNIKTITERSFPLDFRLSIKTIDLANNAFICTCNLLWFRNWMKAVIANNSIVFSQYPHRYECRGPNIKELLLKDFNPTVQSCTPIPIYVIILATILPVIAVTVVTGLLVYRFRWHLLYWMSLLRRRRHKQHDPLREMLYDGFISYSNPDYDWVENELLEFLEAKGLKLCEHTRDFTAGKLIVDNVLDAMDTSRKTILVISNEYMKSSWCQFELQMAFNGSLKDEFNLVVILLEPIKTRHMTSTLRALMTSTTYMEWPDDEQATPLFQQRLENCVRE